MYNAYRPTPQPYYGNRPVYNPYNCPYHHWPQPPVHHPYYWEEYIKLRDYGPEPFTINIDKATRQNENFRIALWTGDYLQLTLMSINVGDDIGLEMHSDVDQFLRIEQGQGIVMMGDERDCLDFRRRIYDDYVVIIPAGKWHNVINTGNIPLKLYSIYSPPEHPHGTVHRTKEEAEEHHD